MKRIDTKDGLFDDGNHVFGIHGTRVSAEFLNDIQEEIVNVIGAKNLDGSKRDQLITAIRNIVKSGGGSSDKLAQSFTVPSVLHDKIQLDGEENTGNYGYSVAMGNNYLAIADPINQEVVIYHRNDNNIKLWNLEDVHRSGKHGDVFVEDGQVYAKRKDGVHLDVFEYDETQTNLTFKKVSTINLTGSFGNSLAIDDEYLIVGNPQASTALIYKHSGIQWQLVEKLSGGTSFGSDVAINHKYVLVSEVANKKAEAYKISRGFDFSAERVTGRFKVNTDVYLNAPTASTAGFLGYTVADDDGVNFYQLAQNLDDNAVYVRKFDGGNNGIWETSNQSSFENLTTTNARTVTAYKKYQRFYSVNQINNKLIVGTYNEWDNRSTIRYAGHLAVEVETNKIYYKGFDDDLTPAWNEVSDKMPLDDFHQMMNATNRTVTVENNTANMVLGRFYYNREDHNTSGVNTYFKSTRQIYAFTQDDVSFVYTGTTGNWVKIQGTRPADPIQLEVVPPAAIKHFKTLTGGASFGKLIDLADVLSAFAEPDNNILKIYENSVELASKTVKADCINVGKGVVLAASKTGKKAYIYDFYSKTGWFTTTKTKWAGLPDNAKGYTGYNITGGQTQLVRLTGTTDVYTRYKNGAWVKNGRWGGLLWYLGSKIGFEKIEANQWYRKGSLIGGSGNLGATTAISSDGSVVFVAAYNINYAEVYEFKGGQWKQKGSRLTGTGSFGYSAGISSDGSVIVVGAYAGNYTEVYEFTGGQWQLKGSRITGTGSFGSTSAISSDGSVVVTGANAGNYAEVYEFTGGQWKLKGSRLTGSGGFGSCSGISSDGSVIIVGAPVGKYTEVYEFTGGQWQLKGSRLNGGADFGYQCSISSDGSVVAIGADDDNYVEAYEYKNNNWALKGKRITGSGEGRNLGYSASIDGAGNRLLVGDADSHYVEVFGFDGNDWVTLGKKIIGTRIRYGYKSHICRDGTTIIVSIYSIRTAEVLRFDGNKHLYLDTNDGKHYYDNKEVTDATKFNNIMETIAPLATLRDTIPQANRNIKFTVYDIQEQLNKTGAYISLLGTGTATTPTDITNSTDTNFAIDNNYGDACTITKDKVLITNKTDSKLAIYDHKGTKEKEIQLETGLGSVIDATDTEAIVGSEKANTVDVINLKI